MANFCTINEDAGYKKATSINSKFDVAKSFEESGFVQSPEMIKNSTDEKNDIIPGTYGIIKAIGLNQEDRSLYSDYLRRNGISCVGFKTSDITMDVSPSIRRMIYSKYPAYAVLSTTEYSGDYYGIKARRILRYNCISDLYTDIDKAVAKAMREGYDTVIISDKHNEVIVTTAPRITLPDKSEYIEFKKSLVGSDAEHQHSISNMRDLDNSQPVNKLDNNERIGLELAQKMSQKMNVEYEIVTVDEAIEKTKNADNKFTLGNKEGAFFFDGKVYLVKGRITANSVFHEFAHPIIRGLRNENQELFDSLYNEVASSPDMVGIVNDVMSDPVLSSPENSQYAKEEIIAKAISAINEDTLENSDSPLAKIMYAIKRFLRRVFGKNIEISSLKPSTTLRELADILNDGNKIYVDTSTFKDENIVVYDMFSMNNVEKSVEAQLHDNEVKKRVLNHLTNVNEGMKRILKSMIDNEDISSLREMVGEKNIKSAIEVSGWYTPENIKNKATRFMQSYDENIDIAKGFVNTMFTLSNMVDEVYNALKGINDETDYRYVTNKVYYASKFVKSWKNFVQQVDDETESGEFSDMVRNMNSKLSKCDKMCDEYMKRNVRAFIAHQLWQMKDFATNRYQSRIDKAKKAGGSMLDRYLEDEHIKFRGMTQAEYAKFVDLYNKHKNGTISTHEMEEFGALLKKYDHGYEISDMRIDLTVDRLMGDVGWFNSMVESFTSSQDLIGMSLATFITQEYGNAMNRSLDNLKDDYNEIDKILKDAGLGNRDSKLRDTLCFTDEILAFDNEGYEKAKEEYRKTLTGSADEIDQKMRDWERTTKKNFVPKKVWTYLNEFKGYRVDLDSAINATMSARNEWRISGKKEDYDTYVTAKSNMEKLLRTYFHRQYVPQFYYPDYKLEATTYNGVNIGNEIITERDEIIDRINALNQIIVDNQEDINIEIDELFKRLRYMALDYNEDGSKKTGIELAKANALKEYNQAKREFYDYTFNLDRFKQAFEDAKNTVKEQYEEGSYEYQREMEKWINDNTRIQPKDDYYDTRKRLLDRKKEILSKYSKSNATSSLELEIAELWDEIVELVKPMRNNDGYLEGFSDEQLKSINEKEDRIDELNDQIYEIKRNLNAITKDDWKFYFKHKNRVILDPDVQKRYDEIEAKIQARVMDQADREELDDINQELAMMQTKQPTEDYIKEFNNILGVLTQKELDYLTGQINTRTIDYSNIDVILSDGIALRDLCENNPAFAEWFDRTHHLVFTTKEGEPIYRVRYAYSVNNISEEYLLNDTNVYNIISEINPQLGSRMPIMKYMDKTVKQQYVTPKIVGKTIDINGEFLPLNETEMRDQKANYEAYTGNKFEDIQVPVIGTDGSVKMENANVDKYRNGQYYELKRKNPKAFKALEKLKEIHIKHQKNIDAGARLYYDIARIRKTNAQGIREGKYLQTKLMRLRQMLTIDETDVYDGTVSYNRAANTVRMDWLEGGEPNEPLMGLFNIDYDLCEDNIFMANERYYCDLDRHIALVNANPIVRTVQQIVNQSKVKNTSVVTTNGSEITFADETGRGKTHNLIDFINALVGREFEGKFRLDQWSGALEKYYIAIYKGLAGQASIAYFSLDIQSALKNFLGQKVQSIIEATGGVGFTITDLNKANVIAYNVINEMVTKGYITPEHSLNYQLMQHFDMIPGRSYEKFASELANTLGRELADGNNGTRLRKLSEMQATAQVGFAILLNKKITVVENGKPKTISYIDAFELKDGKLTLKDGIDVRYGLQPVNHIINDNDTKESILNEYNIPLTDIDNVFGKTDLQEIKNRKSKYEQQRNDELSSVSEYLSPESREAKINEINEKYDKLIAHNCVIVIDNDFFRTTRLTITDTFEQLNGAYQNYSQPMMNEYLLMKPLLFLRKYYMSMLIHKWGTRGIFKENGRYFFSSRFNASKQTIEDGVYIDTINTVYESFIYRCQNLSWMDAPQRANFVRFISELAIVGALLPVLSSLVMFGFDGDDDDKYKAQKDKNKLIKSWSGTIFDKDFNFGGYMRQATLLQLLKLQNEQSQFNPLLRGVSGAYDIAFKSSAVFASVTVDNWIKGFRNIFGLMYDKMAGIPSEESGNYYTRDTGIYWWQKKGAPKFINYFMKSWGLNGSNLDPATSYKNFISYTNM